MVVLKRVNWRRWSGSVALVRVNGGIEKGPGQCGCQWGQVRQGPGFGPDRGVAVGCLNMTLQGCNLYLAGL